MTEPTKTPDTDDAPDARALLRMLPRASRMIDLPGAVRPRVRVTVNGHGLAGVYAYDVDAGTVTVATTSLADLRALLATTPSVAGVRVEAAHGEYLATLGPAVVGLALWPAPAADATPGDAGTV